MCARASATEANCPVLVAELASHARLQDSRQQPAASRNSILQHKQTYVCYERFELPKHYQAKRSRR